VGALDVLSLIPVMNEHQQDYTRDGFGYPADEDGDGDGCDTRAEVLQRDSLTPAQVDPSGCHVIAGDWYSTYDGATQTDPAELEIDHVVALKEAWDSGAWAWQPNRLVAYGNDLDDARSLRAVTAALNAANGDKDPSNWIPPNEAAVCSYLADWVAIKARWGLSMDQSEFGRIRNLLTERCPDQVIAPWAAAPADAPPPTEPPPPPEPSPPPAAPAPNLEPQPEPSPAFYPNCAAARSAGAAPLFVGEPGYSRKLDRDGDGVACE
jgi:hypothetical protein